MKIYKNNGSETATLKIDTHTGEVNVLKGTVDVLDLDRKILFLGQRKLSQVGPDSLQIIMEIFAGTDVS